MCECECAHVCDLDFSCGPLVHSIVGAGSGELSGFFVLLLSMGFHPHEKKSYFNCPEYTASSSAFCGNCVLPSHRPYPVPIGAEYQQVESLK